MKTAQVIFYFLFMIGSFNALQGSDRSRDGSPATAASAASFRPDFSGIRLDKQAQANNGNKRVICQEYCGAKACRDVEAAKYCAVTCEEALYQRDPKTDEFMRGENGKRLYQEPYSPSMVKNRKACRLALKSKNIPIPRYKDQKASAPSFPRSPVADNQERDRSRDRGPIDTKASKRDRDSEGGEPMVKKAKLPQADDRSRESSETSSSLSATTDDPIKILEQIIQKLSEMSIQTQDPQKASFYGQLVVFLDKLLKLQEVKTIAAQENATQDLQKLILHLKKQGDILGRAVGEAGSDHEARALLMTAQIMTSLAKLLDTEPQSTASQGRSRE